MTMTAIIAEDEAPQRLEFRRLLAELWPELSVVAECEDGLTAIEAVQAHRPQIAFLDIRMPGLSGMEIARAACIHSRIVFMTAYDDYALQAFEQGAVDYLLKPIKRERLALTVQRLRERIEQRAPANVDSLLDALRPLLEQHRHHRIQWVTASTGHTTKLFPIDEVIYFKAEEKYTRVVTATDTAFVRVSLKELARALDSECFWQVHRSVIVRVAAIRTVRRGDDGKLTLQLKTSDEELPVSAAFGFRFKPM